MALLMALALSACATLPGAGVRGAREAATTKPRAERPVFAVGEKWIRHDGPYELVRIEKDLYIFASGPRREIHLTKDLAVAKVQKGERIAQFDPPPTLSWPLEVGKWGTSSALWRFPENPRGVKVTLSWEVQAYEDVQVMPGKFKAFRILQTMRPEAPAVSWERRLTIWYAPEIRQFVKAEGERLGMLTFEIITLDRPASEPLAIALREPKDQARVTSGDVAVAGKITSGKGMARLSVTLNGEEISSADKDFLRMVAGKELALESVVPGIRLREGKNVLLVTAVDREGASRQEARTLFYDKPAPPAPAPPIAASPPPTPAKPPEPAPPRMAPAPAPPPTVIAKPAPPPVPTPAAPTPGPPPVAALPPLQVTVSSPRDQARVEQESVGLAGLVSGGKGVSRVQVTLNGVEVSRLEERPPQPALAVNLPLKLREGQNTLVVTATEADGKIYQEVRAVHYEKLVPLTVAFRYPEDRSRVGEEASVVAAVVTSSKGVANITVLLNGKEVHQQTERAPQRSLLVTVPVTLREGTNVLALSASEPDGTVRQELRTIIYAKPKEVAAAVPPPPPPPPTHDRWAVVVGVGRYESPDIPRLRYTVPDAEAIYDVLTGPAGFKKEHVLLLTDKTDKKPTYRNLKWALGTFLARSAKKDDTVLIFFAGHGAPEVDQRGVERDGFSKYLVPSDAEPDDLYSTALPMDELQTVFGRIEAERVVVFLDACYSGAAGGRTFASKKTRSGHVDEAFLERLARSKGRAILTASRPAEVSIELAELGHGLFTYYLIQGLKGAGDLNRDGIVTLQELYEYVEQQVTQKSRAVGGNQHPVMKGELEGALPLVKVK